MANKTLKQIITVCTFIAICVMLIFMLKIDNKTAFRERVILNIKKQEYAGIVDSRYIDKENHNSPILVLSNKKKVAIYGQLYSQIEIGYSIVKRKDRTKVIVLRKDMKIVLDYLIAIK